MEPDRFTATIVSMAVLGISGAIVGFDDPLFLLGIPVAGFIALIAWAIMWKVNRRSRTTKALRDWAVGFLGVTYLFGVLGLGVWWSMETGKPGGLTVPLAIAAGAAPIALYFWARHRLRQ